MNYSAKSVGGETTLWCFHKELAPIYVDKNIASQKTAFLCNNNLCQRSQRCIMVYNHRN